jgi:protein-tyrosine phosphatase
MGKQRVLAVCLGNICRSPLAEVLLREQAKRMGLDSRFEFASAGTGDWHVGGCADPRTIATAARHGVDLTSHRASQITVRNWQSWDWFVAMDDNNYRDVLAMGVPKERLLLMRQFEAGSGQAVPDPYYGGADGFETVWQLLESNAVAVMQYLGDEYEKNHCSH